MFEYLNDTILFVSKLHFLKRVSDHNSKFNLHN